MNTNHLYTQQPHADSAIIDIKNNDDMWKLWNMLVTTEQYLFETFDDYILKKLGVKDSEINTVHNDELPF